MNEEKDNNTNNINSPRNNLYHQSYNPNANRNEDLEKALQKRNSDINKTLPHNNQSMSSSSSDNDLDDEESDLENEGSASGNDNFDANSNLEPENVEIEARDQKEAPGVSGVVYTVMGLKPRIWLWIILSGSVLFFFLLIIIIAFLAKNSDNLNYASGSYFENEEYTELYAEVESVVSSYQSKYGVTVDKYLIISALTAFEGNEMYFDDTESGAYDYTSVDDTDSDGVTTSKTITEMTAKIEILAKYQIKTTTSCSYSSSTMREIASNDDSSSWYNFWQSASDKEKNYDCSGTSSTKSYSLSIDQGELDDENSGGVFYWNLVDESFLLEYYPEYFSGIADDEIYLNHADKVIDYIYLYAEYLRSLDDCDTSTSSSTLNLTTINVTCDSVTVTGDEAGNYDLESYVAGVIADEFTPGYMRSKTSDDDAILEELKAFAIAVRTYTISRTNGCTKSIRNSSSDQNFKPTDNAEIWAAVNATAGVVITQNGSIISAEYDSFDDKDNCNGTVCSSTYTKIPSSETHTVTVPASWHSVLAGGHGRGMSQWGSLYYATLGHNFEEILYYFYADDIQLQSLSGTSASLTTTAYCSRTSSEQGEGICDGTSYYGGTTIGADTLSSPMTLLTCTATQAEKAFTEIYEACGTIPHAGSIRALTATVNSARSSTSFHYTGRAFDLDTNEGMQAGDTYFYVTYDDTSGNDNSHYYRLYCKVTGTSTSSNISTATITPLKWSNGKVTTKTSVTDTFLDVTAVLNSYGLYGIGPRSCVSNGTYLCTEWWHFQDTSGLVVGTTTFETALDQYFGSTYDYSGTPVASYLKKKWNGGSFS